MSEISKESSSPTESSAPAATTSNAGGGSEQEFAVIDETATPDYASEIKQIEHLLEKEFDVKRVDYSDPKVVQKAWKNQRIDIVKRWRVGLGFDLAKPIFDSRMTKASFLRERNVELEKVKKRNMNAEMQRMTEVGRPIPKYKGPNVKENLSSQFRYKYGKNNPVVSSWYIEHYENHKKPPFAPGRKVSRV